MQEVSKMRMLKVKKKVFEKEVLDIKIKMILLDICEVTSDGENLVYDFSRMYWVMPMKLEKIAAVEKQKIEVSAKK